MPDTPAPILSVRGLKRHFRTHKPWLERLVSRKPAPVLRAVDDISFDIPQGTTFALVGESGCGKSTIARCVSGLYVPTSGEISFMGSVISSTRGVRNPHRKHLQMIFQDPYASLNPRWRVRDIIAEPILTHNLVEGRNHASLRSRVSELLEQVGLSARDGDKFPHQFSGGQRQRISIARALASNPAFLVCDEPTSALDVSVQAQILNLMKRLQRDLGLTYLLISHNLAVVAHMADQVGVMYLGRLVEWGDTEQILSHPRHPYTRMLLDTLPDIEMPGKKRAPLSGEVPSPLSPPSGCTFHPRCLLANEQCRLEAPVATCVAGTMVTCHALQEGRSA